ncbi:MAG: repair protein SbcC/Rad50, partial [Actinomycetota bacterium]
MIVRHVYLQNYRVYENVTELDLPEGLVGIYGPNGAGKSYLIESIPWALFGYSRGPVEEVRSTGVNDECVVEITFEHEGHSYVARRALRGGGKTLKHEAVMHCDGLQVATGARDVQRYVQQVIGMNEKGFLASVFAEQKQLAALSAQAPGERRKLVLDLLGITPIESAVKAARRDAKLADETLKQIQGFAADLEVLETERADAAAAAIAAEAEQVTTDEVARVAAEAAEAARERFTVISTAIEEGKRVKAQFDKLDADVQKLEADAAAVAAAKTELDALGDTSAALVEARAASDAVRAFTEARAAHEKAAAALAKSGSAEPADDSTVVAARKAASVAGEHAAGLEATAKTLEATLRRTDDLEGDAECPTCGQPLGEAFEEVRAHRIAETAVARAAADDATATAKQLAAAADQAERELKAARQAWETAAKLVAAEQAAAEKLEAARAAAAGLEEVAASLEAAEKADRRAQQLVGQLARADVVARELAGAQRERDELARELEARRADAKTKGFTAAGLAEADQARRATADALADANDRAR